MLLAEPPRTQFDLHFRLLSIPVRISPFFWVASILLGFQLAQSLSVSSGGRVTIGVVLLIWTLAVAISILVHEFGHALAFRFFGTDAEVVLYHFGGLAIPSERYGYGFGGERWQQPGPRVAILLAGPGVQLVLGIVVLGGCHVAGFRMWNPLPFIPWLDFLEQGAPWTSLPLFALVYSLVSASIGWALLNLLPVYPLDGGQIAREVITMVNPTEGIRYSLIASIAAGAAVAVWAFVSDRTFLGFMFAVLAYSSYATLKAYFGSRGGFGGGRW